MVESKIINRDGTDYLVTLEIKNIFKKKTNINEDKLQNVIDNIYPIIELELLKTKIMATYTLNSYQLTNYIINNSEIRPLLDDYDNPISSQLYYVTFINIGNIKKHVGAEAKLIADSASKSINNKIKKYGLVDADPYISNDDSFYNSNMTLWIYIKKEMIE